MTRGIRNNNPANIRHSASRWQGLSETQTDRQFCQFVSMTHGIRALIITLRTYVSKHRLYSIPQIIRRFAPATENATSKYIEYVVSEYKREGYGMIPNFNAVFFKKFHEEGNHRIYILCRAICWIESNYTLTEGEFRRALSLT